MNVYQELEEKVRARDVRVTERLELLRALQLEGIEHLAILMVKHGRAMEEAAKKVREVLR